MLSLIRNRKRKLVPAPGSEQRYRKQIASASANNIVGAFLRVRSLTAFTAARDLKDSLTSFMSCLNNFYWWRKWRSFASIGLQRPAVGKEDEIRKGIA